MKSSFKPKDALLLFNNWHEKWLIAGGWAIDLFLDKQTREHEDLDILIFRKDTESIRNFLNGWDLRVGLGNSLLEERSLSERDIFPENREVIWARNTPDDPWAFELLINNSEDNQWICKRNEKIRLEIDGISRLNTDGIPYLKPEIVLLHKAKGAKEKDLHDLNVCLPLMTNEAKGWLKDSINLIHPQHEWLSLIK